MRTSWEVGGGSVGWGGGAHKVWGCRGGEVAPSSDRYGEGDAAPHSCAGGGKKLPMRNSPPPHIPPPPGAMSSDGDVGKEWGAWGGLGDPPPKDSIPAPPGVTQPVGSHGPHCGFQMQPWGPRRVQPPPRPPPSLGCRWMSSGRPHNRAGPISTAGAAPGEGIMAGSDPKGDIRDREPLSHPAPPPPGISCLSFPNPPADSS